MSDIAINQIQTPDGTILRSFHTHDFVSYTDKNGKFYAVDGGKSYLKRSTEDQDYFELSVLEYDPFEKIRLYYYMLTDIYLCDISDCVMNTMISKIKECDLYFQNKPDTNKNKINHVIETSLLLQERLYRKKFQVYSDKIKDLIVKYKKEENGFKLDNWLVENLKNVPDPFIECKFLLRVSSAKNSNVYYHEIMKLIWEQLSKYKWLKGNEYETERVLNMVLKPLEE